MQAGERAKTFFSSGFNCAQSVLLAFAEDQQMPLADAARVAAGFGGGMGRQGHTCGAVTGAIMALGLHSGSTDPQNKEARERTYALVQQIMADFTAQHGGTACRELLGIDISNEEERAQARAEGRFLRCAGFVSSAAELVGQVTGETQAE